MPNKIDLTGMRFGRLVVVKQGKSIKYGKQTQVTWDCVCDCGNYVNVVAGRLRSGNTKSCGCYNIDRIKETKTIDLTGVRFGKLTVLEKSDKKSKRVSWVCECDCGNIVTVSATNLTQGNTMSCGCYRIEKLVQMNTTHGESHTRLYGVWQGMRERCYRESDVSYYLYGGRGITVCDEWENSYESFKIWAEANGYDWFAKRGDCTLDRIDVNGMYCPENCRWVDMKVQSNNKRNSKKQE